MVSIMHRNAKKIILFVIALELLTGVLQIAIIPHQQPIDYNISLRSFEPTALEPLPEYTFHLKFRDSVVGNIWIDAPIIMSIYEKLNSSTGELDRYMLAFSLENTINSNPPLSLRALGIGIDEICRYPYVHAELGESFDYWENATPDFIMYRPYAFLTPSHSEEIGGGAAWPYMMQGAVTFGQYLFLDGIKLYFEDNITIDCTPHQLLLWAEFQWNGTDWSTSTGIWDTMSKDTFIDSSVTNLIVWFPLNWLQTILLVGVVSIIVVIIYVKRHALRAMIHGAHRESLESNLK